MRKGKKGEKTAGTHVMPDGTPMEDGAMKAGMEMMKGRPKAKRGRKK